MAITSAENEYLGLQESTRRAVSASIGDVPILRALRGGSSPGEGGLNGYYDGNDNFIRFWTAGDVIDEAPIDPGF